MKILYISQYYPPELCAPAARVSEFAHQWRALGHEVTILTAFPHHPHGTKRPEDRGVLTRREQDGDVTVIRTYVLAAANAGFLLRIVSYLSFMLSAMTIGLFRVGRPDVVIATSPQLFTAVAGWWIAFCLRVPFLFEVRDLWPESIVTVGAMRESAAIRLLKGLAHTLYRAADAIVTVGEGYQRRLLQNYPIPESKIHVIPNGVDLERFQYRETDRQVERATRGWNERIVALYLGTHGMAHGLGSILETADRLRKDPRFLFVFVGDGAEKARLVRQAKERNLLNVEFLDLQTKEVVVRLYAAADICLVPLRKVELFEDVLPSKIFEIMAMGRPIALCVDGEARKLVEKAGAGIFVPPESPPDLAHVLTTLANDPARRADLGRSGQRFVQQQFSRARLAKRYLSLLQAIVDSRRTVKTSPVGPDAATPSPTPPLAA